ncbi:MAG: hypothetical protein M1823_003957 [Watsoniomyces obsoletus]|nr:MAG: hypothetical protein M1823_003957 [Watsoniomyces obsoletus]
MEKGGIPDHLTFPGKSGAGKGPWGRDLVIKDCEQLVPWEIPSEFTMKRVYDALSGLDVKVDAISWMPYCIVVETQDDLPYQKRIPLPSRIASSVAAHMICFTNHFHMGLEEASKAEDDDDGYGRQLAVVNQPGIEGMQVGNFVHVDTESNGGIRTGVLLGVRHRRVPCHGDGDGSNEEEYREFFAYFGQKEGRLLNQS